MFSTPANYANPGLSPFSRLAAAGRLCLALGLALLLLALAGCSTTAPEPMPEAVTPTLQPTLPAALPAPTPLATATVVPAPPTQSRPTPTVAPIVAPTVVQPVAPTVAPTVAKPDAPDTPDTMAAIFADRQALEDDAFAYLSRLAVDVGVRTSGTELERAAAEFLLAEFEELGYQPQVQEFSWGSLSAAVSINAPSVADATDPEANILSGTAAGEATAPLVFVGLGKPEDIPEAGLAGKIALVERGEITFGSKVARVHDAGAVAALIFNNVAGQFQGTLGGRSQIPAVSLSRADGEKLRELIAAGETGWKQPCRCRMTPYLPATSSPNCPAPGKAWWCWGRTTTRCPTPSARRTILPGWASWLAVAQRLAGRSLPYTLRFIAFGSEETGLHGSEYYVESLSGEELNRIYAMINLDSVGSGSALRVSGDRWLVNQIADTAEREDIALAVASGRERGGSDHANFRAAWVPVVFFRSNDLSRINTPQDTMERLNPRLVGDATALTLALLEQVHQLPGYGE